MGPWDTRLRTNEECINVCPAGFVVNGDIFGTGQPMPSGFQPFPSNVVIRECIGKQQMALAQLKPAEFLDRITYAFRIRVQNPPFSPTLNAWSLTLGNEASELFESFTLWQIEDGRFGVSSVPAFRQPLEAILLKFWLRLLVSYHKKSTDFVNLALLTRCFRLLDEAMGRILVG